MVYLKNKLELVCGRDTHRPALSHPYLDLSVAGDPRLVATDGYRLVACKLDPSMLDDAAVNAHPPRDPAWKDVSGSIPIEAFKAARKAKTWIDASDPTQVRVIGGATYPREQSPFPNWRQIQASISPERPEIACGLDAAYLYEVSQALNAGDNVEIRMSATEIGAPLRILTAEGEVHFAVLNPIRLGAAGESPARNGARIVIGELPSGLIEPSSIELAGTRQALTAAEAEIVRLRVDLENQALELRKARTQATNALRVKEDAEKELTAARVKLAQFDDSLVPEADLLEAKSQARKFEVEAGDLQEENKEQEARIETLEGERDAWREQAEEAEAIASAKLSAARRHLSLVARGEAPPAWCDVCDTAGGRHTPDCLMTIGARKARAS